MLKIIGNSGKGGTIVIKKDGNKLGKRKRYKILREFKDILFYHSADIYVVGYNNHRKNEKIWSILGYVNLELNSYLLTFNQAIDMILDSLNAGEFNEFFIFIQGE